MTVPGKSFLIEYLAIQVKCDRAKFSRGFKGENFQDKVKVFTIGFFDKYQLVLSANDPMEYNQYHYFQTPESRIHYKRL